MTDEYPAPPRIAIAHHSGYGHTAVLAEAVAAGARDIDAAADVIAVDRITDDDWDTLDSADAIIFGSPTYMGDVSAAFKIFAEATSSRCVLGTWRDKVAAGFSNSGGMAGDKLHTLMSLAVLASQHHMHWVNLGLVAGWNSTTSSKDDLNRLAFFLGAGAQTDTDLPPEGVHGSDIATCRHLGRRVATVTTQLAAGRLSCTPLRTTER